MRSIGRLLGARLILAVLIVAVLSLAVASPVAQAADTITDSLCETDALGYMCVGIDRDRGGAITFLSTNWSPSNMVDNGLPDHGRQIQASFYRQGGDTYPNCWACNSGCRWGWNAVQAGTCSLPLSSGYYFLDADSDSIFIQTQPRHWDPELGRANFFVGQHLEFLSSNTLKINYQMWNSESFSTGSTSHHELPVVYLEPFLSVPKAYFGSKPFSGGPLTTVSVPAVDGITVSPTEPWLGWFNGNKGVALYVPSDTFYSQTWRFGKIGAPSPPTNYMQNWANISIQPETPYQANVYIITGTVEEIRAVVYELEGQMVLAPPQPTSMTLTIPGPFGSTALMSWAASPATNSYEIEARWQPIGGGAWTAWVDISTVQAPVTQYYHFFPVPSGFRYQTRVRAVNAGGTSAWRTSNTFAVP